MLWCAVTLVLLVVEREPLLFEVSRLYDVIKVVEITTSNFTICNHTYPVGV